MQRRQQLQSGRRLKYFFSRKYSQNTATVGAARPIKCMVLRESEEYKKKHYYSATAGQLLRTVERRRCCRDIHPPQQSFLKGIVHTEAYLF